MTITEQIKVVAKARQEAQELSDRKKAMYDEFISQHTVFFADVATATTKVSEEEDKLRELTINVYQETGNKQPAQGVGIRELTKLEYEPKEAFDWCLDHKIMLKLDTPAFEKMAKMAPETRPGFVKVHTEVQATIASDLSKVIEPVNP